MTLTTHGLRPARESRAARTARPLPAEPPFVFRRPEPGRDGFVRELRRGDHVVLNGDWVLVDGIQRLDNGSVMVTTCQSVRPDARVEQRLRYGAEQVRLCRPAEWVVHVVAEMADVTSAVRDRK